MKGTPAHSRSVARHHPDGTRCSHHNIVWTLDRPTCPRGITLVELLVAVSIITILVSLTTIASLRALSVAAEQQTRTTLANAKGIADAYASIMAGVAVNHLDSSTSPINWSPSDKAYNQIRPWTPGSPKYKYYDNNWIPGKGKLDGANSEEDMKIHSIERFLWAAMQHPTTNKMLATLGEDVFVDDDANGYMELRDGWGKKIIYAAYVSRGDGDDSDNFLPERFDSIPLTPSPRSYFASAGADGEWGDDREADGTPLKDKTLDNLYSFKKKDNN